MPEGIITGGWNYVIAAYSITTVGLALYALSLIARHRSTDRDESQ